MAEWPALVLVVYSGQMLSCSAKEEVWAGLVTRWDLAIARHARAIQDI